MNKYDIKKALKFCADSNDCDDCPYDVVRSCSDRLKLDARELIAEQEKEIERLKDEDTRLTEKLKQVLLAVDTVKEMNTMCNIDKQNAEIERLKDDYAKLQELFAKYQMASDKEIRAQIKQAKIDVLNELKGRLGQVKIDDTKIKFWKVTDMSGTLEQAPIDYKPVNIIIDELIKEINK